jgi:hypothetical protein
MFLLAIIWFGIFGIINKEKLKTVFLEIKKVKQ